MPALLNKVREYVESNYTEPITLNEIASEFGLVAPYLSKQYRDHFGIPIKKYILDLRMDKAKELLSMNPQIKIKDIADLCGYSDQFYLSRVFRQHFSMSPQEYRKNTCQQETD
jgi:two-component system response regulator YesN